MQSKALYINQQGSSHSRCEDEIFVDENLGIFIVADGVSNSRYGKEGAKAVVDAMAEAFSNTEVMDYCDSMSVQDIRDSICSVIDTALTELTESYDNYVNKDEFASTLLGVFHYNKTYIIVHCGDGCIFAMPNVEQTTTPCILSHPDNDAYGRVYHCGSELQLERMRVIRIRESDFKGIAFGSDGFTDAFIKPMQNGFDGVGLSDVFTLKSNEELQELINQKIQEYRIHDDVSAIVLLWAPTEVEEEPEVVENTADEPENAEIIKKPSVFKRVVLPIIIILAIIIAGFYVYAQHTDSFDLASIFNKPATTATAESTSKAEATEKAEATSQSTTNEASSQQAEE